MFRLSRTAVVLLFLAGLAACGGGSSSGGGQLAGNYVGTASYSFVGPGGSFADSAPAVLVVTGAGQIGFASLEGGATSCSGVPPIFLQGNSFGYAIRYNCSFPGLGVCTIVENGSGTIRGNSAFAEANGTITCPGGTVSFAAQFTGTRQFAAAVQSRSETGGVANTIERAM
jgi:hypothetical protein